MYPVTRLTLAASIVITVVLTLVVSVRFVDAQSQDVVAVAWSPNGTRYAVATDSTVQVYNLQGIIKTITYPALTFVGALAWRNDNELAIAYATVDEGYFPRSGAVVTYNITYNLTTTIDVNGSIDDLYWLPGSNQLVAMATALGNASPSYIWIYNVTDGSLLHELVVEGGAPHSLSLSPSGNTVLFGDLDGRIATWAWSNGERSAFVELYTNNLNSSDIADTDINAHGTLYAVSALGENEVAILRQDTVVRTLPVVFQAFDVDWHPTNSDVLAFTDDQAVKVYNASTGTQIAQLNAGGRATTLDWHPNGQNVLVGTRQGTVQNLSISLPPSHAPTPLPEPAS